MNEAVSAANLNNAINSLGKTALRIADERRDLLAALGDVINAADRYGTSSSEYSSARFRALSMLQGMQS